MFYDLLTWIEFPTKKGFHQSSMGYKRTIFEPIPNPGGSGVQTYAPMRWCSITRLVRSYGSLRVVEVDSRGSYRSTEWEPYLSNGLDPLHLRWSPSTWPISTGGYENFTGTTRVPNVRIWHLPNRGEIKGWAKEEWSDKEKATTIQPGRMPI